MYHHVECREGVQCFEGKILIVARTTPHKRTLGSMVCLDLEFGSLSDQSRHLSRITHHHHPLTLTTGSNITIVSNSKVSCKFSAARLPSDDNHKHRKRQSLSNLAFPQISSSSLEVEPLLRDSCYSCLLPLPCRLGESKLVGVHICCWGNLQNNRFVLKTYG